MEENRCPQCGANVDAGAYACKYCGAPCCSRHSRLSSLCSRRFSSLCSSRTPLRSSPML